MAVKTSAKKPRKRESVIHFVDADLVARLKAAAEKAGLGDLYVTQAARRAIEQWIVNPH